MFRALHAAATTTVETSSPRTLRSPSPPFVVFLLHSCSGESKPEEKTSEKKQTEGVEGVNKPGYLLQRSRFRSAINLTKRSPFNDKYHPCNLSDALVIACCELNFLDEAADVFLFAVGRNLRHQLPSVSSCHWLMNRLVNARRYHRALTVFLEISETHEFYLGTYTYYKAIQSAVKLRAMDRALDLKVRMERRDGRTPDAFTYSVLLSGLWKNFRGDDARKMFDEMIRRGVVPTCVTYTTMIHGYIKEGKFDEVCWILESMKFTSLKPSLVTYNSIISGLCRASRMEEVSKVLDIMKAGGLLPDKFTYNSIINGYARSFQFTECYKIITEMQKNVNLKPCVITYGSIMNGLCKNGKVIAAESLLQDMVARGITPNVQIYSILVDGFCKCAEFQNAFRLLEEMKTKGFTPDLFTYNSFISSLCKVLRLVEAEEMVVQLKAEGLTPDVITYTSLIQGYLHRDIHRSLNLYHEMQRFGIRPTQITFGVLLTGLITKGLVEKVEEIHQQMLKNDFVLDGSLYRSRTCIKAVGDVQRTCMLLQDMSYRGLVH